MGADKRFLRLSLCSVTHMYPNKRALSDICLKVESGEILGVTGKNGAGKSTVLKIMALALKPSFGEILVNQRVSTARDRNHIGYLSSSPLVYPDLTCEENLFFFASLHGMQGSEAVTAIKEELNMEGFFSDRCASALSFGQLRKLSIARSLLASPGLMVMDEPGSGLDTDSVRQLERLVLERVKNGRMAVVASHDFDFLSQIATRVAVLEDGEIKEVVKVS